MDVAASETQKRKFKEEEIDDQRPAKIDRQWVGMGRGDEEGLVGKGRGGRGDGEEMTEQERRQMDAWEGLGKGRGDEEGAMRKGR